MTTNALYLKFSTCGQSVLQFSLCVMYNGFHHSPWKLHVQALSDLRVAQGWPWNE